MHASKLNREAVNLFSQSYAKLLTDEFFDQNTHISGQEIISISPIKQVNFFILKVLFEQWQEEAKKFESPYFDYSSDEVSTALTTLANSLSKHIQVEKGDFVPLVEKAVRHTLELMYDTSAFYIDELKKLSNEDVPNELKKIGKYFKLYRNLFDQVFSNIEKSVSYDLPVLESVIKNTVEDFEVDASEQEEVENLFNATLKLDVFDIGTPDDEPKAETALKSEDETNFFDSLEDHESSTQPVVSNKPAVEPEEHVEEESVDEEPIETTEIADDKASAEDLPIGTDEISEPQSVNDQFAESDIQTLNDKFEEKEKPKTIAKAHEEKPVSELASSINLNQRYMFVNDLFEGNEADYNKALDEIDSSDSFDSSVEILVQNYSKKYVWDMNSDEVKELLKVIFKRFR